MRKVPWFLWFSIAAREWMATVDEKCARCEMQWRRKICPNRQANSRDEASLGRPGTGRSPPPAGRRGKTSLNLRLGARERAFSVGFQLLNAQLGLFDLALEMRKCSRCSVIFRMRREFCFRITKFKPRVLSGF